MCAIEIHEAVCHVMQENRLSAQYLRVRPHLTTTMCFFLLSCVNSYIDDNATHL